jgi:hypothetical protein
MNINITDATQFGPVTKMQMATINEVGADEGVSTDIEDEADACLQISFLERMLRHVNKRRTAELSESFGPRVVQWCRFPESTKPPQSKFTLTLMLELSSFCIFWRVFFLANHHVTV